MKQTKTLEINNKEFKAVLQDGKLISLAVPKVVIGELEVTELLTWLLGEVQALTVEPSFSSRIPNNSVPNKELQGRTSVSSSDYGAGVPDLKIQDMSAKLVNPIKINVPVASRPKGT